MNKHFFAIAAISLLSGTVYAQRTPKLLKAFNAKKSMSFEYDNKGRIAKDIYLYIDDDGSTETRTNSYTYAADRIVQRYTEGNLTGTDVRTSVLENGKVKSETIVINNEGNEVPSFTHTFNFTYNAANQLTKIESGSGSGINDAVYEVIWVDGCPRNIKQYSQGTPVGEVNITYDTSVSNPYVINILHPFLNILGYEAIIPYGQALAEYYGVPVKYAVSSVNYVVHEDNKFHWDTTDSFTMTYAKNADGLVIGATQTDTETTTFNFEWEPIGTGISAQTGGNAMEETFYNASGMRQTRQGKGLNIIRSAGGNVRKILK